MCGIFGYYNFRIKRSRKAILELLFTGLRRLEYRGYDSAGISIDAEPLPPAEALDDGLANGLANGHSLENGDSQPLDLTPVVLKSLGNIDCLVTLAHEELCERQISLDTVLDHHAGIAHTRWATHGVPSTINSHPQVSDASNQFVVVHNGIITNFKVLKDFLVSPLCLAGWASLAHLLIAPAFESKTTTAYSGHQHHSGLLPASYIALGLEVHLMLMGLMIRSIDPSGTCSSDRVTATALRPLLMSSPLLRR